MQRCIQGNGEGKKMISVVRMAVCNHGDSKRMQRGLKEVVVTEPLLICTYVCVERVYSSLLSQI